MPFSSDELSGSFSSSDCWDAHKVCVCIRGRAGSNFCPIVCRRSASRRVMQEKYYSPWVQLNATQWISSHIFHSASYPRKPESILGASHSKRLLKKIECFKWTLRFIQRKKTLNWYRPAVCSEELHVLRQYFCQARSDNRGDNRASWGKLAFYTTTVADGLWFETAQNYTLFKFFGDNFARGRYSGFLPRHRGVLLYSRLLPLVKRNCKPS